MFGRSPFTSVRGAVSVSLVENIFSLRKTISRMAQAGR